MKENIVQQKSFDFAVRVVKLYQFLVKEKKEFVLAKQMLRSGTSIGANVEEAIGGQSDKDFTAKMSIAYKEARETVYWLRLLYATDYLNQVEFDSIYTSAEELCKIIGKIKISMRIKMNNS
ncbi:four helix bundle protein [bacterium]|nr:four helix bundle protein [bacterium]